MPPGDEAPPPPSLGLLRRLALVLAAVPLAFVVQAAVAWAGGSPSPGRVEVATALLLAAAAAVPAAIALSGRFARTVAAKRLLLLGVASGFALLLAEGGLRVLVGAASAHPRSGPPGVRVETSAGAILRGVSGTNVYSTNSRGFRGPETEPGDAFRVVTIGGSTTECFFLDDAEEWPAASGAALAAATGKRVWVGNAGRAGHTTLEHLVQIERLPDLDSCDAVVVLCGINDLNWHLAESWRERVASAPERAFWIPLAQWTPPREPGLPWFRYSRLHAGIVRLLRGEGERDPERVLIQDTEGLHVRDRRALRASLPKRDDLPDLAPALAIYRGMLERIVEAARARGVALLLLAQPTIYAEGLDPALEATLWFGVHGDRGFAWSAGALARGMAAFNAEMARVAAERGVPCLRLDEDLPRDASVFYDDCHFTEEGARRVAARVAPALRTILEERGPRPRK
jgi:lysophospholipase L1-like esterase